MTFYTWSTFITSILSICLGLFVYSYDKTKPLNKKWLHLSLSISIWSFGYFLTLTNYFSYNLTLFFSRFSHASGAFIPILFFNFIVILLDSNYKYKKFLKFGYIISTIICVFCLTNFVVKDVIEKMNISYYPEWGILYPVYSLLYIIFSGYGNFILYKAIKLGSLKRKKQLKVFFIGTFLGFAGGISLFFLILNITVPPFASILIAIYPIVTTYAIVKYHLMDIEVIIKKTLIFAILFAVTYCIFAIFTFINQELFQKITGSNKWFSLIPSVAIIVFIFKPLESFLIEITNKYLFQKRYDYKQVLKSFIDEVITVLNLDTIVKTTLDLLEKTLHPKNSAILILNKFEDKYTVYDSRAYSDNDIIKIESNSKICKILKTTKNILSIESYEYKNDIIKKEMKNLSSNLAIPLILHNDLIGIMLLGGKKSDLEYTKEDLDILTDLARTETIAIGNAQLFADSAQMERRAAIGTLAAGINHEIGNPLNIISTKIQVYLLSLKNGFYKDIDSEKVILESEKIMQICLQQISRISEITKKLSNFAKPSKSFKPTLTNIEEQIEETLSVVGHELELERIEIIKSFEKKLPKILADTRQIQQIFFNIIKNAIQAIQKNGKIQIKTYSVLEKKQKLVKIEISDTGEGIPKQMLDKIFEPFVTTKSPGKGTGLGLSIVRQLVWRNKGDIKVKSQHGKGTIFYIVFPKATIQ